MKAINLIDGYKTNHRIQYPEGTELVYSNFTPRTDKHAKNSDHEGIVVFYIQALIKKYLISLFNDTFFNQPKESVLKDYKRRMDTYLGPDAVDVQHIGDLHDLGFLPIQIKALPEGSLCPIGVPFLTIENTDKRFFWLTNYLETFFSAVLWQPITSATTSRLFMKLFKRAAKFTGSDIDFTAFQGHDFSFRGMAGPEASAASGAAHLTSFVGTDTIPAIDFIEEYYNADVEKEFIGCSVAATEHSVMCLGEKDSEIETFRRLITKVHPTGILSIVSDTWDFWKVVTEFLPQLKDEILNREGKVVIRPDSGDPADIICGNPEGKTDAERKGLIECLWEIFGGTKTGLGFKVLNEKIGAIYGDSIDLERAENILGRLYTKGFASCNIVFGIGSYTFQYNTRDTYGFAMKATYGVVNGSGIEIFKDPKTDVGKSKKSAKGLLKVTGLNGKFKLEDQVTREEEQSGELKTVFKNGELLVDQSFSEIRKRTKETI